MKRWTEPGLAMAYGLAMTGATLSTIAGETGRLPGEVDLALWALVGRTPAQALARLNSGLRAEEDPAPAKPSRSMAGFLAEMFGRAPA